MLLDLIVHRPQAIAGLLRGTPKGVWLLLAALAALGLSQCRPRSAGLARTVALPLAMAALGAWGVLAAARTAGLAWEPLTLWLAAALATGALLWWLAPQAPAGTRYDAPTRRFHLPGSPVPLLLILAVFCIKYAVGIETVLDPAHAARSGFALSVAAVYGVATGCFLARVARLLHLARPARSAVPA